MAEYSKELFGCFINFFEEAKLKYNPDEEDGSIRLSLSGLKCRLRATEILMRARMKDIYMLFFVPLKADESNISNIVEYITRINYFLPNARFVIDYRDGEVSLKMSMICEDSLPSYAQIKAMFDTSLYIYEDFSDPFLKVYYGNATPEEAAEEFGK